MVHWMTWEETLERAKHRPLYADQWHDLRDQARTALDRRERAYPEMIAKGAIDQRLAVDDIRGWQLLVDEWHWIITGEGSAPERHTIQLRRDALTLAMARVRKAWNDGNNSHDIARQSHLIWAMQWHLDQQRFGAPSIHATARINHHARARRAMDNTPETERKAA